MLTKSLKLGNEVGATAQLRSNPPPYPRPAVMRENETQDVAWRPKFSRESTGTSRKSLTGRGRLWSDGSSCRPLISAPTNFRHIDSGSSHFAVRTEFSDAMHSQRPHYTLATFERPGDLGYPLGSDVRPSSHSVPHMLPYHQSSGAGTAPQDVAVLTKPSHHESPVRHQRSYSSMSFHVPRRQRLETGSLASLDDFPPHIPPRSRHRTRAHTAPEVDGIKERVAHALIEVEELQKRIDDVVRKQSTLIKDGPANSHRRGPHIQGSTSVDEAICIPVASSAKLTGACSGPMPSIPALPPAAPSFAQRLIANSQRPQTAPSFAGHLAIASQRSGSVGRDSSYSRTHAELGDQPPPVPLPLVLRPPLRKKKSFSDRSFRSMSDRAMTSSLHSGNKDHGRSVSLRPRREEPSLESPSSISTGSTEPESVRAKVWSPEMVSQRVHDDDDVFGRAFGQNVVRFGKSKVGVAI